MSCVVLRRGRADVLQKRLTAGVGMGIANKVVVVFFDLDDRCNIDVIP